MVGPGGEGMGWGGGTIPVLEAKATMATVDTARSTAMTASAQRRDFMYIGSPGRGQPGDLLEGDHANHAHRLTHLHPTHPSGHPLSPDTRKNMGENFLFGRKMPEDIPFLE